MQTSLIKARLLAGTALASDETGMRVGKGNWWLWVFHHADSAVFIAAKHRSRRLCMRSSAIGARITGFRTAMAARWAGQRASIRSASRISSATSNTRSTLATRCSRPA